MAESCGHLHSVYPHFPGQLPGCPACDFGGCHCDPVAVAEGRETVCVWLGHEEHEHREEFKDG